MTDYLICLWNYQIRIGPLVIGLIVFASISALRRITRFEYVPTYFILFPMSVLDRDIAYYYGEGDAESPQTDRQRRIAKRTIIIKSTISTLLTFVVIPALLGGLAAFFMESQEVFTLIIILLVWQGYNAFQSTMDNAVNASRPVASITFFIFFYVVYLLFLSGGIWESFNFAVPYVRAGAFVGLILAVWRAAYVFLFVSILVGVLGNIIAYLITEQELFRSEWSHKYQSLRSIRENDED